VTPEAARPRGEVGAFGRLRAAMTTTAQERRLLVPIALAVRLPVSLVTNALAYHVLPRDGAWTLAITLWIDAVFWPIAGAALIWAVAERARGEAPTARDALRVGLANGGRLFKTELIVTALELLGFLALVVPGAVFAVRWALAEPVVVLEGAGPRVARARSATLVRGHFAYVAAVASVCALYSGLVDGVLFLPSDLVPAFDTMLGQLVLDVAGTLATLPVTVAFVVLYRDLAGA